MKPMVYHNGGIPTIRSAQEEQYWKSALADCCFFTIAIPTQRWGICGAVRKTLYGIQLSVKLAPRTPTRKLKLLCVCALPTSHFRDLGSVEIPEI